MTGVIEVKFNDLELDFGFLEFRFHGVSEDQLRRAAEALRAGDVQVALTVRTERRIEL